jgi:ribosomal protein L29
MKEIFEKEVASIDKPQEIKEIEKNITCLK